jgi:hypothetical protein
MKGESLRAIIRLPASNWELKMCKGTPPCFDNVDNERCEGADRPPTQTVAPIGQDWEMRGVNHIFLAYYEVSFIIIAVYGIA